VIWESHREFFPNMSGPAAIIRIFGATKEGLFVFIFYLCHKIWFLRKSEIKIVDLFVYSVARARMDERKT